jgi:hypothetical protein
VDRGSSEADVEVITCVPPAKVGVTELSSEADDLAAATLASVLVVVDPALGPGALAKLAAAAPAGVKVVDAVAAAPAIAMAVPRLVLAVGARPLAASGTPRSRVGAVLTGTATPARSPKLAADVLLRVPADAAPDAIIDELAASLAALASPAGAGSVGSAGKSS